jgi:hypothetical protein
MSFSSIPTRTNGQKILYGWFEALKTAGAALEAFLGSSFLGETQFTVANNQVAAADVTGLLFAGASVRSFEADVQIYRKTTGGGATELAARCKLIGTYKTTAASWELTVASAVGDDIQDYGPAGLLFTITAAGQVQYTSHNISGTASVSKLKYRYSTMGVET